MNFVIPYVEGMLQEATATLPAEFVRIEEGDESFYPSLLIDLWESGESFTVVEQDVEPLSGFLAEFDGCPWEWDVCSPTNRPGLAWLGCVRFRSALTRRHPSAMRTAQEIGDDGAPCGTPYGTYRPEWVCTSRVGHKGAHSDDRGRAFNESGLLDPRSVPSTS